MPPVFLQLTAPPSRGFHIEYIFRCPLKKQFQVWWHTSLILDSGEGGRRICEFKGNLVYIGSSNSATAKAT